MKFTVSPAVRFLLVFVFGYLLANLAYGWYVETYRPNADPLTRSVSHQLVIIARSIGRPVEERLHQFKPTVVILEGDKAIVNIYEGCNGLNVAIVFISFVLAFGGRKKNMMWFVPLGLLLIHLVNLGRLLLLYLLSAEGSRYFHYFHKYLFTAFIYLFVFILWWWWVQLQKTKPND